VAERPRVADDLSQRAGAPWAIVQSRAALPLKAPLFTGYSVVRTITAVEQKERNAWSRGDVYRVTLDIDAQAT